MAKHIGILTSGGDCPGLNAAIRGVGKAGIGHYDMQLLGFRDGFYGLAHDRTMALDSEMLSGILTDGGTILGTSRDKPHKIRVGNKTTDMTDAIIDHYDVEQIAEAIRDRGRAGKHYSIIAVAEGAMTTEQAGTIDKLLARKEAAKDKGEKGKISKELEKFHEEHVRHTQELTQKIEKLTGCESRLTILGHVQRGGTPSPRDRVLATQLGTACATYLADGGHGDMMAVRGSEIVPVPLEEVAGRKKLVAPGHPLVESARLVGTCFGDAR